MWVGGTLFMLEEGREDNPREGLVPILFCRAPTRSCSPVPTVAVYVPRLMPNEDPVHCP